MQVNNEKKQDTKLKGIELMNQFMWLTQNKPSLSTSRNHYDHHEMMIRCSVIIIIVIIISQEIRKCQQTFFNGLHWQLKYAHKSFIKMIQNKHNTQSYMNLLPIKCVPHFHELFQCNNLNLMKERERERDRLSDFIRTIVNENSRKSAQATHYASKYTYSVQCMRERNKREGERKREKNEMMLNDSVNES